MAREIWHEKQPSTLLGWLSGVETMWCGIEADEDVVTSNWWRSVNCPGCLAAMKAAKE